MPTYDTLEQFSQDWAALPEESKRAFLAAIRKFVHDLRGGSGFRKGPRVKGVQGHPGIYELTWAPDGRATFAFGSAILTGEPHIIWRRVGGHDIFARP